MTITLLKLAKRYKIFLGLLAVNFLILVIKPSIGARSFELSWSNFLEMMTVIPPIFVLLGLMDVWVKRETMIKYMGNDSGFIGILIAFFMGSVAAGPLYAAFPIAIVLLKKGSKFSNVIIFIGAWSTTKIPKLLFEASALGTKFLIVRLVSDILGIAVIAFITGRLLTEQDKKQIYDNAESINDTN